jgi:hypothetical protein
VVWETFILYGTVIIWQKSLQLNEWSTFGSRSVEFAQVIRGMYMVVLKLIWISLAKPLSMNSKHMSKLPWNKRQPSHMLLSCGGSKLLLITLLTNYTCLERWL